MELKSETESNKMNISLHKKQIKDHTEMINELKNAI
jgi:hypothetical protein